MGSYLDTSWADLRELTYERRRERLLSVHMAEHLDPAALVRAYRRLHGVCAPLPWEVDCVRISIRTSEFRPVLSPTGVVVRNESRARRWRRAQWREGNRTCFYCEVEMENVPKKGIPGPRSVTVDHRHPLVLGGADHPNNYTLACVRCNSRKGALTEAEFRALLPSLTA